MNGMSWRRRWEILAGVNVGADDVVARGRPGNRQRFEMSAGVCGADTGVVSWR